MEIKNIKIQRILNPTGIDLAEYVINPYKGCSFGCLYCYVRFNKVTLKDPRPWGTYIDIKTNLLDLLEKEIKEKKPKKILLGSTTECFQHINQKKNIMEQVLNILNKHKIHYSILTRSTLIQQYIPLLKKEYTEKIYFTINQFPNNLKNIIEPKSPSFKERIKTINILLKEKLNIIPYFCPILPNISNYKNIFGMLKNASHIEFEALNFNLGNIQEIIKAIKTTNPNIYPLYKQMTTNKTTYIKIWNKIKQNIEMLAKQNKITYKIHIHKFNEYFKNTYL